jgi:hypothetical protein
MMVCHDLLEVKVENCERFISYIFVKKALCAEALNAAGDGTLFYPGNGTTCNLPKNDRLAVYGDIVAAQILCRRWYHSGHHKGTVTNSLRNYFVTIVRC